MTKDDLFKVFLNQGLNKLVFIVVCILFLIGLAFPAFWLSTCLIGLYLYTKAYDLRQVCPNKSRLVFIILVTLFVSVFVYEFAIAVYFLMALLWIPEKSWNFLVNIR